MIFNLVVSKLLGLAAVSLAGAAAVVWLVQTVPSDFLRTQVSIPTTNVDGTLTTSGLPTGQQTIEVAVRTKSGQRQRATVTFDLATALTASPTPTPAADTSGQRPSGDGGGGGGGGSSSPSEEAPPARTRTVRVPAAGRTLFVTFIEGAIPRILSVTTAVRLNGDTRYSSINQRDGKERVVVLAQSDVVAVTTIDCPIDRCLLEADSKHDAPGPVGMVVRLDGKPFNQIKWDKSNNRYEKKALGLIKKGKHVLHMQLEKDHFSCSALKIQAKTIDACDRNLYLRQLIVTPATQIKQRLH